MNKRLVFLYVCLCVFVMSYFFLPNKIPLFANMDKQFSVVEYIFYANNYKVTENQDAKIIKNGNSYIVKTSVTNANKTKKQISKIQGEAIKIDGSINDVYRLINFLDINIILSDEIDNLLIFYGLSNKFGNCMYINNKKINVEIAYKEGSIVVGNPIILGDY